MVASPRALTTFATSMLVIACGARSDLDPTPGAAGGEGGGGGATSAITTGSGASGVTTSSSTGGGGEGGGPPACEPPIAAWSLEIEDHGRVVDPASVTDDEGTTYLFAAYAKGLEHGMVLSKIDACGNVLWLRTMPDARPGTTVGGVIVDGVVLFAGEGVIAAFSEDGDALWSRLFDNTTIRAMTARGGAAYVTGRFSGLVDIGGHFLSAVGGDDIFTARIASDGAVLWAESYGSPTFEEGTAIAVGETGTLCLGTFGNGTISWPQAFTAGSSALVQLSSDTGEVRAAIATPDAETNAMATLGDDCLAIGGYTTSLHLGPVSLPTAADGWNGFAARIGPLASVVWARPFGPDFGMPRSVVVDDGTGSVLLAGSLHGAWQFEEGSVLGTQITKANSLFVLSLERDSGGFTWGRTFDGSIFHRAEDIHPLADGSVIVTGTYEGVGLDFGQGPLGGSAQESVFVARIDGPGLE
jgi:hypothetical protein